MLCRSETALLDANATVSRIGAVFVSRFVGPTCQTDIKHVRRTDMKEVLARKKGENGGK